MLILIGSSSVSVGRRSAITRLFVLPLSHEISADRRREDSTVEY